MKKTYKKRKNDKMKVKDAAEFLGVCAGTLRNWHKQGKLVPEVNPLTKYRMYSEEDLMDFLARVSEEEYLSSIAPEFLDDEFEVES